jgi:uncharacterized membrane protein YhaH (DUF805 family)
MSDENLNPNQNTEQTSQKLQEISEIYNPPKQSQSSTGSAEVFPEMSPIDYYVRAFQKYSQFSGRATRAEYWWFYLVDFSIFILALIVEEVFSIPSMISGFYLLISLIPMISVQVRRLHDVSKSGWILIWPILFALISFLIIPIILVFASIIWIFVLTTRDSTPGDNKYGPNPKGIQA